MTERHHPVLPGPAHLRVRPAQVADAARVAEVHVAAWRAGYAGLLPDSYLAGLSVAERTTSWQGHLDGSGTGRTLVAVIDESALGFTSVGPSRDDDAATTCGEIWGLYTHPDSWARGVGAALMQAAHHELQGLGFTSATLWVLTDNSRARSFYEGRGWRADGQSKVDWRGDVRLDEVRYEIVLGSPWHCH